MKVPQHMKMGASMLVYDGVVIESDHDELERWSDFSFRELNSTQQPHSRGSILEPKSRAQNSVGVLRIEGSLGSSRPSPTQLLLKAQIVTHSHGIYMRNLA